MSDNSLRRYELKSRLLHSEVDQLSRIQLATARQLTALKQGNNKIEQSWNAVLAKTLKQSNLESVRLQQFIYKQNLSELKQISTLLKASKLETQAKQKKLEMISTKQQMLCTQLDLCQSKSSEITLYTENMLGQELADSQVMERAAIGRPETSCLLKYESTRAVDYKSEPITQEAQAIAENLNLCEPINNLQPAVATIINQNNRSSDSTDITLKASDWEAAAEKADLMQQANSRTKINYSESSSGESLTLDYMLEAGRNIRIEAKRQQGFQPTSIKIEAQQAADKISLVQNKQQIEKITKTNITII